MTKNKNFVLEKSKALNYFKFNLNSVNRLSSEVLRVISDSGVFFTLLPEDVNDEFVHNFDLGGIAEGMRDLEESQIYEKMQANPRLACVFDDFENEYPKGSTGKLYVKCGLYYKNEIYYTLNNKTVSREILSDCFLASNTMWHSLCLLTETDLTDFVHKEITDEKIKEICAKVHLVMICAYDAEGYVFWERISSQI
jgi:hypothetical protein